jgi:hypothetical protein
MKEQKDTKKGFSELPACAEQFIDRVIKKMRYRRNVRRDVKAELAAHFEDELEDCKTVEQREQKARQLVGGFGDVKLLAILLRRAKKRCRPLWRKAVVRSFQAVGVVIIYLLICFAPLVGRPKISVNYVDWLNDKAKAGREEAENAYPYYKKAVEACVKMPDGLYRSRVKWPDDLNDVEIRILLKGINDNKKALDFLIEGNKRPHYWPVYRATADELSKGVIDAVLITHFSGYRSLVRTLGWRSRYKACKGDIDLALDDCVSLVRFGIRQQGKGLLYEQTAGMAFEAYAHHVIWTILEKVDVPADTLKNLHERLQAEYDRHHGLVNLEMEKVFSYDYIQRSFTDDGKGGGRMLARGAPLAVGDWKSGLWRFVSLSYPDRREMTAKIDRYFVLFTRLLDITPWQLQQKGGPEGWGEIAKDSLMLKITAPAYGSVVKVGWRMKADRTALLTVLALKRYEKENGRYPENLRVLVEEGYLEKLPMDPYSDGALVYRRTDDGFLLYSCGEDLKDDGGKLGLGGDGKPRMWADDGDWVFWPVPKS